MAASPASAAAGKNTLAAIVEASAEQDAFEATVRHHLPGAARTDAWASDVRDQQAAFAALEVPLDNGESDLAQRLVVLDRMTRLRGLDSRIQTTAYEVAQWADRLDADLDHIARLRPCSRRRAPVPARGPRGRSP